MGERPVISGAIMSNGFLALQFRLQAHMLITAICDSGLCSKHFCHPEDKVKSLYCFTWVREPQLVMTLFSIFLGCMWQVQCFWPLTTVTSSLMYQAPKESFLVGDTALVIILLHFTLYF